MKFIHAADIHLDSPLCGLAKYAGAPVEQMQSATRRAFINLIELALNEAVDFLILAGDLYDGDWKDYNTGLFFHQQMSRLREADIPVFIVRGNHDAGNTITRQLRLPDNVTEFSTRHPETIQLDALHVAIHGQSFATKAVKEDLSAHYPAAIPDYFNIGILHTAVNGREGHANYAPCSVAGLVAHGYDYWALGHVHTREILQEQPWVVFPGNLQGRHVKETGAKGCTLVTAKPLATGGWSVELSHCAVDVLRWAVCEIAAGAIEYPEELLDKARWWVLNTLQQAEGRPLAVRFKVVGQTSIHRALHRTPEQWINEIRATATDAGLGNVWVEKVLLETQPLQANATDKSGALSEVVDMLRTLPEDGEVLQALSAELKQLKQALPIEARHDSGRGEALDLEHPDTVRETLRRVEDLLMARLLAG